MEKSQTIITVKGDGIKYGNFNTANPELTERLPHLTNLGLTSPGFIDNASDCKGLDFINTNPSYDKLTFQQCSNKFQDQYFIPEQGFVSLLKNLKYTFSVLPDKDKEFYINELNKFIESNQKIDKNIDTKKENFNIEHYESDNSNKEENCKSVPNYEINNILIITVVILLCFIIFGMIFNKYIKD